MTICNKEITIYHLLNNKVGSSCNVNKRTRAQGYKLTSDNVEILEVIQPNELTFREVWELEQDYAVMFGFEPEPEHQFQFFLLMHTQANEDHNRVGVKVSEESRALMSVATSGDKHPKARKACIYSNLTGELVASNVVIQVWADENKYGQSQLSKTARADRNQPHHRVTNVHSHKGIYARYVG